MLYANPWKRQIYAAFYIFFFIRLCKFIFILCFPLICFSRTSCTENESDTICIATNFLNASSYPSLAQTKNLGLTWNKVANIEGLPNINKGGFSYASCAAQNLNIMCVVTGAYEDIHDPKGLFPSVLVQTIDSGSTWKVAVRLYDDAFTATTCIGYKSKLCFAATVGSLIFRTNNGTKWEVVHKDRPYILTMSCTNNGSLCFAGGLVLTQTFDQGNTWSNPEIEGAPSNLRLFSSDCMDENKTQGNNICVVVGHSYTFHPTQKPFLAQTLDGGKSWKSALIKNLPETGEFRSVSCTSQNQIICIAVGNSDNGPLMAVTTDSGKNWFLKDFNATFRNGKFNAVTCQPQKDKSFCVVGVTYENIPSKILETNDNGEHWIMKNIDGHSGYGSEEIIYGLSCLQDGYCVGDAPHTIFQRSSQKNNWSVVKSY